MFQHGRDYRVVPGVGSLPSPCVQQVPHGTIIKQISEGLVELTHSSFPGGKTTRELNLECQSHFEESLWNGPSYLDENGSSPKDAGYPSGYQCTQYGSLKNNTYDGWWATAGAYLPDNSTNSLGGMSGRYIVPSTPELDSVGQTLFYFLGAQNTKHDEGYNVCGKNFSSLIVQPVLAYDPGCKDEDQDNCPANDPWCNGTTGVSDSGWCAASWYCCASGTAWYSPWDQEVEPGDTLDVYFNISDDAELMKVSTTNQRTMTTTSITGQVDGIAWDWMAAAFETYQISDCKMLPFDDMLFENVSAWFTNYTNFSPEWWFNPDVIGPGGSPGYPGFPNASETYSKACGVNVIQGGAPTNFLVTGTNDNTSEVPSSAPSIATPNPTSSATVVGARLREILLVVLSLASIFV